MFQSSIDKINKYFYPLPKETEMQVLNGLYPLYVISGISGSGKTTLGKMVAPKITYDDGIVSIFVDEDNFYIDAKSKVQLSNGKDNNNLDTLVSINPKFTDVIRDMLKHVPVLLVGFALPEHILPVRPKVHIHLITANNPKDLFERCMNESKSIDDNLMVKEVIIPFYHQIVKESEITHLLNVYDGDQRKSKQSLCDDILAIINDESTNLREHCHIMNVSEPYYSLIKSGDKKVEGRKISPTWSKVRKDDEIIMRNGDESFKTRVKSVTMYLPSIGEPLTAYLEGETLERTLPNVNSIEDGRNIYLQWSTEDEINEMGMMSIEVELIVD